MRLPTFAGLVLLFVGIVVLVQGGSFKTRRDVLDLGGLKVTATESHPIAPWLGGAAALAGAILIVAGLRSSGPRARF